MLTSKARPIIRFISNIILLASTILICLITGEALIRLKFDPGDYLEVYYTSDAILGRKIDPHSPGHDAWGFRNKTVPSSVDILALGDSQTYGYSAPAPCSWPATLGRLTGKSVYNMGIGGYCPLQYDYLLKELGIKLKPQIVIAGFYLGNDMADAWVFTHKYKYWHDLALSEVDHSGSEHVAGVDSFTQNPEVHVPLHDLRTWLSHHSVLYRLITGAGAAKIKGFQLKNAARSAHGVTVLDDKDCCVCTGLTPEHRFSEQNLEDPKVREGLSICENVLAGMNDFCAARGIKFMVVIIPSKEAVYGPAILRHPELNSHEVLARLLASEDQERREALAYFAARGIPCADALGALQSAARREQIYPISADSHPTREGYAAIAGAVQAALKEQGRAN